MAQRPAWLMTELTDACQYWRTCFLFPQISCVSAPREGQTGRSGCCWLTCRTAIGRIERLVLPVYGLCGSERVRPPIKQHRLAFSKQKIGMISAHAFFPNSFHRQPPRLRAISPLPGGM